MPSIIQFDKDAYCKGFNNLDTLVIGVDIPEGSRWAPFIPVNNDENLSHYSIDQSGRLLYQGALIPNPIGFKHALNYDTNIPDLAKVQLTPYLVLVDGYESDPISTAAAWQRVKTVLNIDPNVASLIEQYASNYGMTLVWHELNEARRLNEL